MDCELWIVDFGWWTVDCDRLCENLDQEYQYVVRVFETYNLGRVLDRRAGEADESGE